MKKKTNIWSVLNEAQERYGEKDLADTLKNAMELYLRLRMEWKSGAKIIVRYLGCETIIEPPNKMK